MQICFIRENHTEPGNGIRRSSFSQKISDTGMKWSWSLRKNSGPGHELSTIRTDLWNVITRGAHDDLDMEWPYIPIWLES